MSSARILGGDVKEEQANFLGGSIPGGPPEINPDMGLSCISVSKYNRHIGTDRLVHYREVVLFWR